MFKVLKVTLLSSLLAIAMNAGDFLSSVTNGELSDNSIGITRLDDANMQKVKGGLEYSRIIDISANQAGVYAEYQEKIDGPYLGKEYRTALGPFAYNMNRYFVMYAVTRNIEASRYGRYVVFKYDMGAYDDIAKEYHSINNSGIMNNNSIISRLRDKFKTSIENHLSGWTVR